MFLPPQWAGVLSRLALEQERILNPVLDRVRTADHHQLRSLTGLIRNLSRHARNKDEMCECQGGPGRAGDGRSPPFLILGLASGYLRACLSTFLPAELTARGRQSAGMRGVLPVPCSPSIFCVLCSASAPPSCLICPCHTSPGALT